MTDIQMQIVFGTVLGGSSLAKQPKGKNYYLSMRSKDAKWLQYKIGELHNYFNSAQLAKQKNTYRCDSSCSEEFTNLYNKLYCEGVRHVSEKLLDQLRAIGLAIWWLEGGCWAGRDRKNAYINTTLLGNEGTEIVYDYFNNILDMPCNINRNKTRRKILFTVQGTRKLWYLIEPEFPDFYRERIKRALTSEGSGNPE